MGPFSPDMLSAIANCVVAIANVVLFSIGFMTLRRDRRRIERMEEGDRRRFAENVYAWIEERSADSVRVVCRNGGNSAIYDVTVCVSIENGSEVGERYAIELMKPLEERNVDIPFHESGEIAGVMVRFRDPAGSRWMRSHDGRLIENIEREAVHVLSGSSTTRQLPSGPTK